MWWCCEKIPEKVYGGKVRKFIQTHCRPNQQRPSNTRRSLAKTRFKKKRINEIEWGKSVFRDFYHTWCDANVPYTLKSCTMTYHYDPSLGVTRTYRTPQTIALWLITWCDAYVPYTPLSTEVESNIGKTSTNHFKNNTCALLTKVVELSLAIASKTAFSGTVFWGTNALMAFFVSATLSAPSKIRTGCESQWHTRQYR